MIVQARTVQAQMQLYRFFSLRLLVVFIFFYIPILAISIRFNEIIRFHVSRLTGFKRLNLGAVLILRQLLCHVLAMPGSNSDDFY